MSSGVCANKGSNDWQQCSCHIQSISKQQIICLILHMKVTQHHQPGSKEDQLDTLEFDTGFDGLAAASAADGFRLLPGTARAIVTV